MATRCWVMIASAVVAPFALGCESGGQTGDVGVDRELRCCAGIIREVSTDEALSADTELGELFIRELGPDGERVTDTVLVAPAKLWADRSLEPPSDRVTTVRSTVTATGARYIDRADEPTDESCRLCPDSAEILVAVSLESSDLHATLRGSGSLVDEMTGFFFSLVTLDELGECYLEPTSPDGIEGELYCGNAAYSNRACLEDDGFRDAPVDPRSGLDLAGLVRALENVPLELDCGSFGSNSSEGSLLVQATFPQHYCPPANEEFIPGTVTLTGSSFANVTLLPVYATLDESGCMRAGCSGSCPEDESRRCTRIQVLSAAGGYGELSALDLLMYVEDDGTRRVWVSVTRVVDGRVVECTGDLELE